MRPAILFVALCLSLLSAVAARAQSGPAFWVQIEAQPTRAEAERRARAWAQAFPDVAGFRMASGWYAITLGPYPREQAAARLAQLLADNLIPPDSFLAAGEVYRTAYWPPGGQVPAPAEAPAAGVAPPEAVAVAPLPAAPPAPAAPEASAAPPAPPPPPPEETLAEARAAEGRLSREERQAIQSALQWAGFYSGGIDGAFGAGTRGSITAWQTARGFEGTGYLTARQRDTLLGERAALEAALGLQTVDEAESGIQIPLPLRHVQFDGYAPPFVTYAEKDGSGMRVVLISQPGGAPALRGLYDLLQSFDVVPPQGPRSISDRSFSIEAADARRSARAYAEVTGDAVKGWMLIWEPKAEALAQQALPLMRAGFRSLGARALDPGLVPLDGAVQAAMLAGMEVRRPERSRSGFYVSAAGDVLTVAEAVRGCGRITLDGATEARLAFADEALGIAVVSPIAPLAPQVVADLSAAGLRPGSEIAVAGYSYGEALPAAALTLGTLAAASGLGGEPGLRRLAAQVLEGDAGGPVLDARGAVVGLLLPPGGDAARQLPAGTALALAADRIAARLAEAGIAPQARPAADQALSPDALHARATRLTVLVSCWN